MNIFEHQVIAATPVTAEVHGIAIEVLTRS